MAVERAIGTSQYLLPSIDNLHTISSPPYRRTRSDSSLNWSALTYTRGRDGDEVEDMPYNMNNARRRSNSSTNQLKDFKTKFETIETEPVFEEELHGAIGEELEKQSTTSSSNKSVDEEDHDTKL